MSLLDFLFRRNNPTNAWTRSPGLALVASLHQPALNGVLIGSRFDDVSFLGRDNASLCYFDLGVSVDHGEDGTLRGFSIVLDDEDERFQPYRGTLAWKGEKLDVRQWNSNDLTSVFGDWYWMDTDDSESIAFYEYPEHEMQIELTLSGKIKRFILTKDALMADPEQREHYNVDKPWPPRFST